MKISPFERTKAKREIARQLADIRGTGWLVNVVEENEVIATIDCFDGDGECMRMLIDPLGLVPRAQAHG